MKTYVPIAAAAVVLAIVGTLLLSHHGSGPQPASHPAATLPARSPTSASTSASSTPAVPNLGDGGAPLPAKVADQRKIVTRFAHAFTSTVPQKQWIQALKPNVTADLLDGFQHTDPRLRPTGHVATIRYQPSGIFRVDYHGGDPILIQLVPAGAGWRISSVVPVPPPSRPAPPPATTF